MRPKRPFPARRSPGFRYAVTRTLPRRSSRLSWPGGVIRHLLSACRGARWRSASNTVSVRLVGQCVKVLRRSF